MKRVIVSGAGGKLAGPIIDAVSAAADLELAGLYNPKRSGTVVAGMTVFGPDFVPECDVLVETAHPDVVFENLARWKEIGCAVVVGTSGFTPQRLEQLAGMWGEQAPCWVIPNFSVGAVLMMKVAREFAAHFEAAEVIERHHSTKSDAPSGTALATAMRIADGGGRSSETTGELVDGARGGLVEGIRVHSVRLPGVIAQQEVVFSNPGEMLTVNHLSTSYQSFASGALLAVRKVGDLAPGVHLGLETVL